MILTDGTELYHASYTVVDKIDLSLCANGKDFGKGFYATTNYDQACRFIRTAIGKALKNHIEKINPKKGYVSVFEYKADIANAINYFEFKSSDKHWLHCIVAHRKNGMLKEDLEKWRNYDIIAGKIANDSTNQVLTAYMNGLYGKIGSLEADNIAIRLLLPNKLCDQVCFRTEKAILNLHFKGFKIIEIED